MSVFRGGATVHPVSRVIVAQRLLIIYGITAGTKGNPSFAALNSNWRYQDVYRFYGDLSHELSGAIRRGGL